MTGNDIRNIYIIGLGALGGMYAAKLFDMNPTSVKIIANENRITNYKSTGIAVNQKRYQFEFIAPNHEKPFADLIIIAVKNAQLQQAIKDIKPFVGADTIVISLLNGISSEAIIGEVIGIEHVLYAYGVGMDAVRQANEVTYANPGKIVFGEKNNATLSNRVEVVKKLFEQAQIPYQIPVDMERALWSKFMINTGINQASAVLKAPYGIFQQPGYAQELMLIAASEVVALSNACGIHLNQADLDEFVRIMNTLSATGKTSMLQDIEAKRPTEVDLFAGTVIALGQKHSVPTPVNDTLFRIIKTMEQMY